MSCPCHIQCFSALDASQTLLIAKMRKMSSKYFLLFDHIYNMPVSLTLLTKLAPTY